MFDPDGKDAARWCEAIEQRTREVDRTYLQQLQCSTLVCLRKCLPPDVSAHIASALPPSVRGVWFGQWSPAETTQPCKTVEEFVGCVRPFVRDHHADEVIEEDVVAVAQTFFAQWPQADLLARPYLPAELFLAASTSERGSIA